MTDNDYSIPDEPIPAFDPMNPMFGQTDVGAVLQLAETAGGPVVFIGFRTSNCTFTVPFDSAAELSAFIDALSRALVEFKEAEVKARFQLPPQAGGLLLLPNHLVDGGPTSPLKLPRSPG